MFIRETLTRQSADQSYRSVRLVENQRYGTKVKQKTLLNLGATFPIPKHRWPELVEIIEAELARNQSLFAPDPELAEAAEAIVRRLRGRAMAAAETEEAAPSAA